MRALGLSADASYDPKTKFVVDKRKKNVYDYKILKNYLKSFIYKQWKTFKY